MIENMFDYNKILTLTLEAVTLEEFSAGSTCKVPCRIPLLMPMIPQAKPKTTSSSIGLRSLNVKGMTNMNISNFINIEIPGGMTDDLRYSPRSATKGLWIYITFLYGDITKPIMLRRKDGEVV